MRRLKILKIAAAVVGGMLLVIQLFRPTRDNPAEDPQKTIEAVLSPPPEVDAILMRGCGDCHSNRTRWPWYTNVAPVSWFVAGHVHDGRKKLSFSTWGDLPVEKQAKRLKGICKLSQEKEMPLSSYLLIHTDAKLSDADVKTLCDWTDQTSARLVPAAATGG
jgi:hypothetical protein